MRQAYTPSLQVVSSTLLKKRRELPVSGQTLVEVGDDVDADTPVLKAELPGDLTIVRVAERMGFDAWEVVDALKVQVGDKVSKGQLLCEQKTFFSLFTSQLFSPAAGDVEFFTAANAHLGIRHQSIPLYVDAYIQGRCVGLEEGKAVIIESKCALIEGIFGVGGERQGEIFCLPFEPDSIVGADEISHLGSALKNKVVIGGSRFTIDALHAASRLGASAVVTASIDSHTLSEFVGREIGVSITGDEDVPFSLIITEGFGSLELSERVLELAKKLNGKKASVNGATQVRAGATRPEVIVPDSEQSVDAPHVSDSRILQEGARVRIVRVPYFGKFGMITSLPSAPQKIPSGALVRVLHAKLEQSGEEVVIPRANIELV